MQVAAVGARDRRGMRAELSLGCHCFPSSFQRDRPDPWNSEPPGGTFPPSPAQPKPFLEQFPKAVDEPKPHKAAEPNL